MKLPRVLHVFNSVGVSGPERLVFPQLPRLESFDVHLVLLVESRVSGSGKSPAESFAESSGIRNLSIIPVNARYDRSSTHALGRLLDELRPEIVHSHGVKAGFYLLKALKGLPDYRPVRIATHHGVRGSVWSWQLRLYEELHRRIILPRFDRVLCVCESDRALLARSGISSAKLRTHFNGIDAPALTLPDRMRIREETAERWDLRKIGVSSQAFRLGIVGRLSPEKNHARALRILALVRDRCPSLDFALFCFGVGPLESELRSLTRELRLERQVFWMGFNPRIQEEVAGLDLLLSLSRAEGLPVNLIEAGWAGTPVFATRVDGVADLIPAEEFGIAFPPSLSDAEVAFLLQEALKQDDPLREKASRFQDHVRNRFSGSAWRSRLQEIYFEALFK